MKQTPKQSRDKTPATPDETNQLAVDAVTVALRSLGGVSKLVAAVFGDLSRDWPSNPRVALRAHDLEAEIRREFPALRERIKQLLQHLKLSKQPPDSGSRSPDAKPHTVDSQTAVDLRRIELSGPSPRAPQSVELGPGLHSEVPLFDASLDWSGKADLIHLAEDECSIVDFKTGTEKEDHSTQILTYALLWERDLNVNPHGIPLADLSVVYAHKTVEFRVPDAAQVLQLATELAERTAVAKNDITRRPVPARPSREACEWCDVRQLCPAYWQPGTRALIIALDEAQPSETSAAFNSRSTGKTAYNLADVELAIVGRQGEWSWHGRILETGALTTGLESGNDILLRARPGDNVAGRLLEPGSRVRVLGASVVDAPEEFGDRRVVLMTRATEIFLLPPTVQAS